MDPRSAGDEGRVDGRTRRQVIGGAATAGAGGVLLSPLLRARAAEGAAPVKPCAPEPAGIPAGPIAASPDGRRVWTTDLRTTTITPHATRTLRPGRPVHVGGAPVGIAISVDGRTALVTTAIFDRPGLQIVDLRAGGVDRVDVGADPGVVGFGPGDRAWVTGRGARGTLTAVDVQAGDVHAPVDVGAHPRGLAVSRDGQLALVALNGAAAVAVVDLRRGHVTDRIPTAPFPAQVALSPDARRAVVTHNGFGATTVSLIDVTRHRVLRRIRVATDPAGVAFSRTGATALVTSASTGTVTLLDGRSGRRRRIARTGGSPRAVVVCGTRGVVADGRTGALSAVRLGAGA
jgi:DNA-binding beta-propeller fold protein YncE